VSLQGTWGSFAVRQRGDHDDTWADKGQLLRNNLSGAVSGLSFAAFAVDRQSS